MLLRGVTDWKGDIALMRRTLYLCVVTLTALGLVAAVAIRPTTPAPRLTGTVALSADISASKQSEAVARAAEAARLEAARIEAERVAAAEQARLAAARAAQARASRAASRPRPVIVAAEQSTAPVRGDCNAWGWTRTRAESDACWRGWVAQYDGWNVNAMLTIIYCESHGDPWAGKRYVGLLQVDNAPETRGNGPANIAVGYRKFLGQGYSAWPTCRHRAGV